MQTPSARIRTRRPASGNPASNGAARNPIRPNRQSPITKSPITDHQSPIANRQSPNPQPGASHPRQIPVRKSTHPRATLIETPVEAALLRQLILIALDHLGGSATISRIVGFIAIASYGDVRASIKDLVALGRVSVDDKEIVRKVEEA